MPQPVNNVANRVDSAPIIPESEISKPPRSSGQVGGTFSKKEAVGSVYNLTSRRDAGNSLFSRRSTSAPAPTIALDLADKHPKSSTSSFLFPAELNDPGHHMWRSPIFGEQDPGAIFGEQDPGAGSDASKELDEESSWNWRHAIGQQVFHVIFSMHVHSIKGLPTTMEGRRLVVHWSRKEEGLQTMPSRVFEGEADFDETLRQRCTISGSKSANHGIKYEPKFFALSVVALDVDELEFGKHELDLARLLPEYPGGVANDNRPANWTTNFELTGMAKGITLVVTFNYDLVHHEVMEEADRFQSTRSSGRWPSNPLVSPSYSELAADPHVSIENFGIYGQHGIDGPGGSAFEYASSPVAGLSGLHGASVTLFQSKPSWKYLPRDDEDVDFTFPPAQSQESKAEYNNRGGGDGKYETDLHLKDRGNQVGLLHSEERKNELRQLWEEGLELSTCEKPMAPDSELDLDEEVDLVAGEFLNLLDVGCMAGYSSPESESDSPRARLLKQFEQESALIFNKANASEGNSNQSVKEQISRGSAMGLDMEKPGQGWASEDDINLASIMDAAELELRKATQKIRSKTRAKILEDAETEALMQHWGLNEKSFESSPHQPANSLDDPFLASKLRVSEAPPLGRGLGPVIKLKDGGALRSMSLSHFQKNGTSGSLVMQVSRPVVVPSTMGTTALDILRNLASYGVENLAMQAMTAMPLENVSGKTAHDIARAGTTRRLVSEEGDQFSLPHSNRNQSVPNSVGVKSVDPTSLVKNEGGCMFDEYVSLEDLAPLAMHNIEALAIDGLKIQADMTEEETPSYLDAAAWGILDDLKKQDKNDIGTSQSVVGMHFSMPKPGKGVLSGKKQGDLLSMAITLEEWTRLDAGAFDDVDSSDKTLAFLAAHKSYHADWELKKLEDTKQNRQRHGHARREGIMGKTLMIAMLVQLRDPLHNNDPIGAPMMALIQAERVMVPPKPRIGRRVATKGNNEEDDELKEVTVQKVEVPQFKVTGVHMSGLKTWDDEDKKGRGGEDQKSSWGNQKQLQSGSRWLIAHGMGKAPKQSLLKSKPAPTKTKVKLGETLWSISARSHASGNRWQDKAALNPHIRNPDVIFADDTVRTK